MNEFHTRLKTFHLFVCLFSVSADYRCTYFPPPTMLTTTHTYLFSCLPLINIFSLSPLPQTRDWKRQVAVGACISRCLKCHNFRFISYTRGMQSMSTARAAAARASQVAGMEARKSLGTLPPFSSTSTAIPAWWHQLQDGNKVRTPIQIMRTERLVARVINRRAQRRATCTR